MVKGLAHATAQNDRFWRQDVDQAGAADAQKHGFIVHKAFGQAVAQGCRLVNGTGVESAAVLGRLDALRRTPAAVRFVSFEPLLSSVAEADMTDIHWAIVGGESGPKARAVDETWVEEIEALCR